MSKRRSNSNSKRSNSNASAPEISPNKLNAREVRLHSKYGVEFKRSKCCVICKSTFGFFLPGHFCRFCGQKICHKCSPTKREIEGSKHLKRICNDCVAKESHAVADEVYTTPHAPLFVIYRLLTNRLPDFAHMFSLIHLHTLDKHTETFKIYLPTLL